MHLNSKNQTHTAQTNAQYQDSTVTAAGATDQVPVPSMAHQTLFSRSCRFPKVIRIGRW